MPLNIKITDNFCEILTQEIEVVTLKSGELKTVPLEPFGVAVALGDYAIRDDSDKSVPVFDRPIIGYREEDYKAAQQAKIESVVGMDFAPVIAGIALKSAQVEAARLQVVKLAEDNRVAAVAIIAAAQAQAAKIIDDAQKAAAVVSAVAVGETAIP